MVDGEPIRPGLVVGLGNPGRQYEGTRHNIGFEVLDELARRWAMAWRSRWRFGAVVADLTRDGRRVLLAKPTTFMNRSGMAARSLLDWLKLGPNGLIVVLDDADLALGRIRLRASGGSGGHNGLASIIQSLGGSEAFARIRVGIGRSGPVGADITSHVLQRFSAVERMTADQAVTEAADALECCLTEGLTKAMNRFNKRQIKTDQDKKTGDML